MRTGILTVNGVPLVDAAGNFLGAIDDTAGLIPISPEVAAFLDAGEDEYILLLLALLPSGWAWPKHVGTNLRLFVETLAVGFARLHTRIVTFLTREADPRSTSDMLPDWERAYGLPDVCTAGAELSIEQRRSILVGRITGRGGQSPAFLRSLAASHGYDISLEEYRQTTCIDPCTRPVYGPDWQHAFTAHAAMETISVATCQSLCTAALRTWGNARLECVINRAKPAHTIAIFAYSGASEADTQLPSILDGGSPSSESIILDGGLYNEDGDELLDDGVL